MGFPRDFQPQGVLSPVILSEAHGVLDGEPWVSWHALGTLAAAKRRQVTRRSTRKYLCYLGVSGAERCATRTENPRVGGSIPPLATMNFVSSSPLANGLCRGNPVVVP